MNRRILLASVLVAGPLIVPPARAADDHLKQKVNAIFASVTRPGDPGLAVLVMKNGHVLFEKGYMVAPSGSAPRFSGSSTINSPSSCSATAPTSTPTSYL
jgi:CubicO group peptidase (beta-lactamase class C family)